MIFDGLPNQTIEIENVSESFYLFLEYTGHWKSNDGFLKIFIFLRV